MKMRTFNVTFKKKVADSYINPQIGKGYETDAGHIDVIINAVPINWDGKMRLWLNEEKAEEE